MDGAIVADRVPETAGAGWPPLGLAGSVALHAGLLAALFVFTPLRDFVVPEPSAIAVDLIPMGAIEPEAVEAPAPPQLATPAPAEATEAGAPALDADGTFHATRLYAGPLLDTPEMDSVRRSLNTVADSERVVQLCNIEALEQIKAAKPEFFPDTLVAYAFGEMNVAAGVLTAPGAAFRSRRRWWSVSLRCAVAPDYSAVTAFEFTLGDEIPRNQWEEHYLTEEEAEE